MLETINSLVGKISDAGLIDEVHELMGLIDNLKSEQYCYIDIPENKEYQRVAANGKFKLFPDRLRGYGYEFIKIQDGWTPVHPVIDLDNNDFMHYFLNKKIIILDEQDAGLPHRPRGD